MKNIMFLIWIAAIILSCSNPSVPPELGVYVNKSKEDTVLVNTVLTDTIVETEVTKKTFSDICKKIIRFREVSYVAGQGGWQKVPYKFCLGFTSNKIYVIDSPYAEVGTEISSWEGKMETSLQSQMVLSKGIYTMPNIGGIGYISQPIEMVSFKDGNNCFIIDETVYCNKIPNISASFFTDNLIETAKKTPIPEKIVKPKCETSIYYVNSGDTWASIRDTRMRSYSIRDVANLNDKKISDILKIGTKLKICVTKKRN